MEGFANGLLHTFYLPAEILALAAFGLVIGSHTAAARRLWLAFLLASLAAIFMVYQGWAGFDPGVPLLIVAMISGLFLASALPLPPLLAPVAGAFTGMCIGLASMPDPGSFDAEMFTIAGSLLSANAALYYVSAGVRLLNRRFSWPWLPIAFRVAGSWIAAIALLLCALTLRMTS